MNRNLVGNIYGRSSKKKWLKLTNQKQELPVAAKLVNGLGRNVQNL
jgi:hypothetical protein